MKNIKTYEEFGDMTFKKFLEIYHESVNLSKIINMFCNGYGLIDLIGVEKLTALNNIYCSNNRISSLYSLRNLINLNTLSCYNNRITSLDPIKNLINLTSIDFCGNDITSPKPIMNLVALHNVDIRNNPIDWVDYIDKEGRIFYIKLPKSIVYLRSDEFETIEEYWEFMDKNQPSGISRKFNF